MALFSIKIAGAVFQVRSLFESTRDYCRAYLTEEAADCIIEICREDLDFEQRAAREEAELEGFRYRNFPDPYLERTAIQRKAAEFLFSRDVLVFHGSVVAVDGQGIQLRQHIPDGIVNLLGGGDGGIAQGIVKDIFPAHDGGTAIAVLEQLPDHTTVGAVAISGFVVHSRFLLKDRIAAPGGCRAEPCR